MVTAVNRQRVASSARWTKALERAVTAGIDILDIAGDPTHFAVESQSRSGVVHLVDAVGRVCSCEAAMSGDPVCAHRAIVRFAAGLLTMPVAPAVSVKEAEIAGDTVDCGACHGRGWWYAEAMGGRVFPEKVSCQRCGGTGQMRVRLRTIPPAANLRGAAH